MSNERIDHAAEARKTLDWLSRAGEGAAHDHGPLNVAAAQVHAVLALVEQMRIANLVALATADFADSVVIPPYYALVERVPNPDKPGVVTRRLRPDIAAALGIEVQA